MRWGGNGRPGNFLSPKNAVQALKAYEGYYKMGDAYIHISAVLNSLVLKQMWDDQEIGFTAQTALEFANDDGSFPLKFTTAADGTGGQI